MEMVPKKAMDQPASMDGHARECPVCTERPNPCCYLSKILSLQCNDVGVIFPAAWFKTSEGHSCFVMEAATLKLEHIC